MLLCLLIMAGAWLGNMALPSTFRAFVTAVVAVPLALLITPRARREFAASDEAGDVEGVSNGS